MWLLVMFFFPNLSAVHWSNFDVLSYCVCALNLSKRLIGTRLISFAIGGFNFVLSASK